MDIHQLREDALGYFDIFDPFTLTPQCKDIYEFWKPLLPLTSDFSDRIPYQTTLETFWKFKKVIQRRMYYFLVLFPLYSNNILDQYFTPRFACK